jgi:hypothetical protein
MKKRNYKPSLTINIDEVSLCSVTIKNQLHVKVKEEILNSTPAPLTLSRSSVLFSVCADGSYLPSIVLISQNIPQEFISISNENLRFLFAPKGWMNRITLETIFSDF